MTNVVELDKKWYTNKDVVVAVKMVERENEILKGIISEVLSYVQRSTSEMTIIREEISTVREYITEVKEIASEGKRTTDEIKHTKFYGQVSKLLPDAMERAKKMAGGEVRKLIHRAAKAHEGGQQRGYTAVYEKLRDVTGVDLYAIGKITLKKTDGIDGWKKDPSYINAILKEGVQAEAAVICMQILADK